MTARVMRMVMTMMPHDVKVVMGMLRMMKMEMVIVLDYSAGTVMSIRIMMKMKESMTVHHCA